MSFLLDNPVFNALNSLDEHLGSGTDDVKFFDKEVSPFVGIRDGHHNGFDDLYHLLPEDRRILYASRKKITEPRGWKMSVEIEGLQFIIDSKKPMNGSDVQPLKLGPENVDEMTALAKLTKPGPFDKRTIEFGNYFGIFEAEKLVAMTGQRMHVPDFTEVSAVCTHPDYLGRGYAGVLLGHQIDLIFKSGHHPFLHVRSDNARAISIYERIGFKVNGPMNFYFLKRL